MSIFLIDIVESEQGCFHSDVDDKLRQIMQK